MSGLILRKYFILWLGAVPFFVTIIPVSRRLATLLLKDERVKKTMSSNTAKGGGGGGGGGGGFFSAIFHIRVQSYLPGWEYRR